MSRRIRGYKQFLLFLFQIKQKKIGSANTICQNVRKKTDLFDFNSLHYSRVEARAIIQTLM